MLATQRSRVVPTALLVIAALAAIATHSTAKGAKPGGGGTTSTYTLTDLRGLSGGEAVGYGLSNPSAAGTIKIVGFSHAADGQRHPTLWEAAPAAAVLSTDLGAPIGNYFRSAFAVNDSGLIVGSYPAFVQIPGIGQRILPGTTTVTAVNNLGDVACHDRVWHVDAQGNIASLVEFSGAQGSFFITDINDERGMAGSQDDRPAIAWFDPNNGTVQVRKLGLLSGTVIGRAEALNDLGVVVGWCGERVGTGLDFNRYIHHAFVWTAAGGMIALAGPHGTAYDINDSGQIVGTASGLATLWQNGKQLDLNVLSAAGKRQRLLDANAINDSGQIVGSLQAAKEKHAYLLTPKH